MTVEKIEEMKNNLQLNELKPLLGALVVEIKRATIRDDVRKKDIQVMQDVVHALDGKITAIHDHLTEANKHMEQIQKTV